MSFRGLWVIFTLLAFSFAPRPEGGSGPASFGWPEPEAAKGLGVRVLGAELLAYIAPTSPASRGGPVMIWNSSTSQSTATGGIASDGSTLAWSSDGRLAWWAASDQTAGVIDLWDGHQITELSHAALREYGSPTWSGDGRLAWTESHAFNFQRIDIWDGQTILDLDAGGAPTWSRDGRLAWIGGGRGQEVHIWDGKSIQIFSDKSTTDEGPAWSDDGRLAWTVNDTNQYFIRLWDGKSSTTTTSTDLTTGYALRPVWSADGRLAWTHIGRNRDIYVWDGKTTTNVSDSAASDDFPVWSSDGRLAWESRSGDAPDIFVWDGQTVTNVSNSPDAADSGPTWSSDGRLAWTSDSGDAPHIMLWDGKTISTPLGDTLALSPSWSGARQAPWAHP